MTKYRMMETTLTDLTVTLDGGAATAVIAHYDVDARTGDRTRAASATLIHPEKEYADWAAADPKSSERLTLLDAPAVKPPDIRSVTEQPL